MIYDALMRALEKGGEPNAADRDLLAALERLATDAQHGDASEAAANAYLSVQNAIAGLRDKKIREQRRRQRRDGDRAARKERLTPGSEHVARLVRMKARQLGIGHPNAREERAMRRTQEEMPIDEARRDVQVGKLSPVEERAIKIILGGPKKSNKNRIEIEAIKLADAVKADWFAEHVHRPPGRPKGSMIGAAADKPDQLSSVSEVIDVVAPPIQELAGATTSMAPGSTMIATVMAAVRVAGLDCAAGLAAELVRRVRRRRAAM
jgi:hypothetical protein